MRIAFTKCQINGVEFIMRELVNLYKPITIPEKLVYIIVKKVYNKIRVKSEALRVPQAGYGLTLTDEEAMALHTFLINVYIPTERYLYEAIQITNIINQIDKKHG